MTLNRIRTYEKCVLHTSIILPLTKKMARYKRTNRKVNKAPPRATLQSKVDSAKEPRPGTSGEGSRKGKGKPPVAQKAPRKCPPKHPPTPDFTSESSPEVEPNKGLGKHLTTSEEEGADQNNEEWLNYYATTEDDDEQDTVPTKRRVKGEKNKISYFD